MKKTILIFAILLSGTFSAQVKYFLKGGGLVSQLPISYSSYNNTASSITNAYIGVGLENKFNKNFAVEGDMLVAGLGGNVPLSFDGTSVSNMKLNLGTILIPVSIKYYPVSQFALLAGLNIGFITSAIGTYNGEKGKVEDIKTFNNALHFGAEAHINNKFFVEGRYNLGLSNIIKTDATTSGLTMKNNFFQIGLGYSY